jgi:hypothetical protein
MAYTDIDKSDDYFTTFLWTGDGTSPKSFTGVGFQADMMWSKIRTDTHQHNIVDTVRGVNQRLISTNLTNAEDTTCTHGHFDSLDSDGFTITGAGGYWNVNTNAENYVGWLWKAGGTGVSNTQGSIASTVSANTTSGFSVVSWTGTGTNPSTVGHGLGTAPSCIILRDRNNVSDWYVGHDGIGWTDRLKLNTTQSTASSVTLWNNTAPTSLVFTISSALNFNGSPTIAYCFAEKKGFSKFGSYTGNGVDTNGTFVYTGFKPAFIITKNTISTTANWLMQTADGLNTYNPVQYGQLRPNLSNAEVTAYTTDFLSNGFKFYNDTNQANSSGETFIYMAFAENPLVTSTGIPTTAR